MKRILGLLVVLLLGGLPVGLYAGSYTITTTPEEDTAIAKAAAKSGQTAEQYMQEYLKNAVKPHVKGLAREERNAKWKDLEEKCDGGDQAACGKLNSARSALDL